MAVESKNWVCGAMWPEAKIDHLDDFIKKGIWYFGYDPNDPRYPASIKLRSQMRVGDRIALKRMLGRGNTKIAIRAIGTITKVKGVKPKYTTCCDLVKVRWELLWLDKDSERRVDCKGCLGSIHGPFKACDPWTKKVFSTT